MSTRFTAACVQFTAGPAPAANLDALRDSIREAHGAGAQLVMTPETSDMMEPRRKLALEKAQREDDHADDEVGHTGGNPAVFAYAEDLLPDD